MVLSSLTYKKTWCSTWARVGGAVSSLHVWAGTAAALMLWGGWTAESLSYLDARVTFWWTLRPQRPCWPATIHWKYATKISLQSSSLTHHLCWVWREQRNSAYFFPYLQYLDNVQCYKALAPRCLHRKESSSFCGWRLRVCGCSCGIVVWIQHHLHGWNMSYCTLTS